MRPHLENLDTKRLRLRTVRRDDAPALRALMSPAISRWVAAWPYPLGMADVEDIVAKALAKADAGLGIPMVITALERGDLLGWIKLDLTAGSSGREAEIGYWIAEHAQGRGLAFEAAQALIAAAFEVLGLPAVVAGAQRANAASHHLLAKLGMRQIGERMVYAPARQQHELCLYWQIDRVRHGEAGTASPPQEQASDRP